MKIKITTLLLFLATLAFSQEEIYNRLYLDSSVGFNKTTPGEFGTQYGIDFLVVRVDPTKHWNLSYGVTLQRYEHSNQESFNRGWMTMWNTGIGSRGGDKIYATAGVISGKRLPFTIGLAVNKVVSLTDQLGFVLAPKLMYQIEDNYTLISMGFGLSLK